MAVKKFVQPNYSNKTLDQSGFESYCGEIESSLDVLNQLLGQFAPYASTPPDMKVNVTAGGLWDEFNIKHSEDVWAIMPNTSLYLQPSYWASAGPNGEDVIATVDDSNNQFVYMLLTERIWRTSNLPSSRTWSWPTHCGSGVWVVPANGTNIIAKSTDGGLTWSEVTVTGASNGNWNRGVHGASGEVLITSNSIGQALYTTNGGSTWSYCTIPFSNFVLPAYQNSKWIILASGASTTYGYATSISSWTTQSWGGVETWNRLIGHGGYFYVGYSSGGATNLKYSSDGLSWSTVAHQLNACDDLFDCGSKIAVINDARLSMGNVASGFVEKTMPEGTGGIAGIGDFRSVHKFFSTPKGKDILLVCPINASRFGAYSEDGGDTWKATTLPPVYTPTGVYYAGGGSGRVAGVVYSGSGSNKSFFTEDGEEWLPMYAFPLNYFSVAASQTGTITAPTSNPRIDRLGWSWVTQSLIYTTGVESATPEAPVYAVDVLPICQIRLVPGQSVITNAHITDERGIINLDSPLLATVSKAFTINKVPRMTSNTAPSGTASANSEINATYAAWKAFDWDDATFWNSTAGGVGWLAYEFSAAKTIAYYELQCNPTYVSRSPKTWTFEGWNGTNWIVLDTQTNAPAWTAGEIRGYEVASPASYIKYRLNITASQDDSYIALGAFILREAKTYVREDLFKARVNYITFPEAGVYKLTKPAQARIYRISAIGSGGGGGGCWCNAGATSSATGGGGGGPASLPFFDIEAEDLWIRVGEGGLAGNGNTSGGNNAQAGADGEVTIITGVSSGKKLTINAGGGGGPGVSTPAGGAAGTAGSAPTGGFAGTAGTAGATGTPGTPDSGNGGAAGEQAQLRFAKPGQNNSAIYTKAASPYAAGIGGAGYITAGNGEEGEAGADGMVCLEWW